MTVMQRAEAVYKSFNVVNANIVNIERVVGSGDPKDVICNTVHKLRADTLVMGSHGYGFFKRYVTTNSWIPLPSFLVYWLSIVNSQGSSWKCEWLLCQTRRLSRGDRQAQMTMGIEKDPIELADFFKSRLNFIKKQLFLQYTYRSPLGINQVV